MRVRGATKDQACSFSIRYIKANYFQHNIKFFPSPLSPHTAEADDVTQEGNNFLMSAWGFASTREKEKGRRRKKKKITEKASAIGRRKFSHKNGTDENMLKRIENVSLFIVGKKKRKMCVKAHGSRVFSFFLSFVRFNSHESKEGKLGRGKALNFGDFWYI